MAEVKNDKEFGKELMKFYKEFLLGTAESVKILADIETKYPSQYEVLKVLKDDPKAIIKLSEEIPEEMRASLFQIVVEGSFLAERMHRVFDLTIKEKEKLSKEIEQFAGFVEKLTKYGD